MIDVLIKFILIAPLLIRYLSAIETFIFSY